MVMQKNTNLIREDRYQNNWYDSNWYQTWLQLSQREYLGEANAPIFDYNITENFLRVSKQINE